jgi:hypothetical protein
MRRILLSCGGIILGLAAVSFLGGGSELFAGGTTSLDVVGCIIGLSLIAQGAVVSLGAALCLGRAMKPLASAPNRSETTASGSESATTGGGPVLPICGVQVLYVALLSFVSAQAAEGSQQTWWTFGVLWLLVGGALIAAPLFLKRRVWQLGWRVNGAGCKTAVGGLLISGIGLCVWRFNGTLLNGAYEYYRLMSLFGVLAGTIVTVFGGIRAVARNRTRDRGPIEPTQK